MKITRQKLIDLADQEAQKRAASGGLLSAYLIGTVAHGEPLLGETADIDMVLIHNEPPPREREVVRLSHQIHFDITHHAKQRYEKPSQLRIDPWLGPALCEPVFLFDPDHFFEWAQAGARGQYYRADHTYTRALAFLDHARQQASLLQLSGRWVRTFLLSVMNASNSIASLHKFPVAGRRLTLALKQQTHALERPDVYGGFLKLIGADQIHEWAISELYQPWAQAFDAAIQVGEDKLLVECRKNYYLQGFQALADMNQHKAVLWPLLKTWERSIFSLNSHPASEQHHQAWEKALALSKFDTPNRAERELALMQFIERVQTQLEAWALEQGV